MQQLLLLNFACQLKGSEVEKIFSYLDVTCVYSLTSTFLGAHILCFLLLITYSMADKAFLEGAIMVLINNKQLYMNFL